MNKQFNPAVADKARQLIGHYLRERREDLGLTQEHLASMIGCHRNRIIEMERGAANYAVNQLLAALGCLRTYIQLEPRDPDNDVPGMGPVSPN